MTVPAGNSIVLSMCYPSASVAWLASLDARAAKWPRPVFWGYTALKYGLAALGVWVLIGVYADNLITRRIVELVSR